jgi:hypothetical protein
MKPHPTRFSPIILGAIIAVLVLAGCASEQAPAHPQVDAINTLRTQLELPILPLEFVETTTDSNSPTGMQIEVYKDAEGRKYSVDTLSYQVVEMDARALLDNIPPLTYVLSEEEIRAKAMKLISAAIPGFESLRINWTYEEGGKVDNYFFTWYGEMAVGAFNPPRAQIAIHKTGLVFGYYNTLMLNK